MCSGRESKFTLVHDIEKLRNGDFLLLGNLIGLSIICGCAGPRCFIPGVVSKLFTREQEVQFTILDVPDIEIQTKLEELQSTACEDSFQACLQSFPERFDAGITRHSIKFEDKSMFIQTICEHFCVSRCLEELQDLAKGIDILGLYSILAEHYDEAKTEFIICGKTKSKDVIAIFGEINYTEVVENDPLTHELRDKEEDIYYNFSNFIETLEFEDLKLPTVIQIDEDVEMNAETTISLNDVVRFCTGSKFVMPAMKKQGIIAFTHPDEFCQGKRIVAYTCTYKLVFPVTERYCGSSEDFCKNFCDDIASAPGFGIS